MVVGGGAAPRAACVSVHLYACASMYMPPHPPPPLPPVRVRQCGLSHSNGESEREEQFWANVATASLCEDLAILPHREAFVAGRDGRDNAGLGSGGGERAFFWETAVLTLTHMQTSCYIHEKS